MRSRLIRKDPDAGKDWRQEEKGMAEDEMVGWHHWLSEHEFESMGLQRVRHVWATERQQCWIFLLESIVCFLFVKIFLFLRGVADFISYNSQKSLAKCIFHLFYCLVLSFHSESEVKSLNHVWLFATPWTVAHQAPPSMGSSRQEYWSGLPFPSPGDLPDPGIEPRSPALEADALTSEPPGKP